VHIQVEEGRYSNPTDYVRHLIRQDILHTKAQKEFSVFIKEGITSPSCKQSTSEMFVELKLEIEQIHAR